MSGAPNEPTGARPDQEGTTGAIEHRNEDVPDTGAGAHAGGDEGDTGADEHRGDEQDGGQVVGAEK